MGPIRSAPAAGVGGGAAGSGGAGSEGPARKVRGFDPDLHIISMGRAVPSRPPGPIWPSGARARRWPRPHPQADAAKAPRQGRSGLAASASPATQAQTLDGDLARQETGTCREDGAKRTAASAGTLDTQVCWVLGALAMIAAALEACCNRVPC
jgi:hypothetical protein